MDPVHLPSPDNAISPISALPVELIWKIIECAPKSVCDLRLTSCLLRNRVDEYALTLTVPFISELRIVEDALTAARMSIKMTVPKRITRLVALRFSLLKFPHRLVWRSWDAKTHCALELNTLERNGLMHFNSCMSNKIEKVALSGCDRRVALVAVTAIIDGIRIAKLRVGIDALTDETAKHLLDTLTSSQVDELQLFARDVTTSEKILLDISSIVSSLYIGELRGGDSNFIRVGDVNWAFVFIEMLSRRLDKLCIHSVMPEVFGKHTVDLLRERLPRLDKKVWFYVNRSVYEENLDYTLNNNLVKVVCYGRVSIRHSSRHDECFETFEQLFGRFILSVSHFLVFIAN